MRLSPEQLRHLFCARITNTDRAASALRGQLIEVAIDGNATCIEIDTARAKGRNIDWQGTVQAGQRRGQRYQGRLTWTLDPILPDPTQP